MGEADYQLALLMQHKFETESLDLELARALQKEFNDEEPSGHQLAYAPQKRQGNASNSLVDPSWEIIDPTPDVHVLFVVFDERFFWKRLSSVSVSWSKRMTSCAGICSYERRGGSCKIALSEPLLKLRPRKDLVETLLHEMIHAYLFVTHNNRDRDGHGMEFQKHMFRINKESGTNITIYHDFHDEVRLYKTHWWKCNGPCRDRKPYYGMVKRAMNRPPGPNDLWWGEHSRNCGGEFVKIREPEKESRKKSNAKVNSLPGHGSIKKFFPGLKTKASQTVTATVTTKSLKDESNSPAIGPVIPKFGNIHGFTNGIGNKSVVPKTGEGNILDKSAAPLKDYSNVRKTWLNKFPTPKSDEQPKKKPKLFDNNNNKTDCPLCNKQYDLKELNSHIDKCLHTQDISKPTKNCIICDKPIPTCEYEHHVTICAENTFKDDVTDLSESVSEDPLKQCEVCKIFMENSEYDLHLFNCLSKMFDDIEAKYDLNVDCLACGLKIPKKNLNQHLEECMNMSNIFDEENLPSEGKVE